MKSMALWAHRWTTTVPHGGWQRCVWDPSVMRSACDDLWWVAWPTITGQNHPKPHGWWSSKSKKIRLTKWWSGNQWKTLLSIWKSLGIHWESLATSRQAFESRAARRGLEMVFWSWDTCHGQSKWSRLCLKHFENKVPQNLNYDWLRLNIVKYKYYNLNDILSIKVVISLVVNPPFSDPHEGMGLFLRNSDPTS